MSTSTRPITSLVIALLAAAAGPAPPIAAQEVPVPLWQPPPLLRPRVGDLARAELRATVAVDASGRPTSVEVSSIEPTSPADGELRHFLEREAMRWRFAPAVEDGVPVAGVSRLLLRYEFDEAAGDGAVVSSWMRRETATERRARTWGRPLEEQREALAALVASAEALLAPGARTEARTRRVVLRTDLGDQAAANALANNIEVTLATLDTLFGGTIAPQPLPLPLEVVVYGSRSRFTELAAQVGMSNPWVAGFFGAPGLLAFHTEVATAQDVLSILLHESTHAWLERLALRPGVLLPEWFSEGLAEYVGSSEVRKGALVPGKTVKRRIVLSVGVPWLQESSDALSLQELRAAHRKGEGLRIADLVAADRDIFYGSRANQFYTTSWLLVHFLRHGEKDWEERFSALLLAVAEGYNPAVAVESIYGAPLDAFEDRFAVYVKRF